MQADFLCATPAAIAASSNKCFGLKRARGVIIDEVASICRSGGYEVWGNNLMPLLVAGDHKQLAATVMSVLDKDGAGHFRH